MNVTITSTVLIDLGMDRFIGEHDRASRIYKELTRSGMAKKIAMIWEDFGELSFIACSLNISRLDVYLADLEIPSS